MIARFGVVLWLGAVFAAHAMTLGELQGNALIGRSLDLSLPVQTSPGDELSEGCVRADIYYGEAQQKAPRISLQATQLRLQLSEPVNEPVVKVQIRTFCGASQIRNYVLLADLPPDFGTSVAANTPPPAAAAQPDRSIAGLAPAAVVLPQGVAAETAKPGLLTSRKSAPSIVKNKKAVKKQKTKAATTRRARDRKPASGQPAKSVLKLDPMEILSDRMDSLELNMPFAPAEDALLQSRQITTLQAELKSMHDLAVKNDSALLELRGQLKLAQSQQQLTPLLYGLIALLLLGVAGLAWLWQGQKKLTATAKSWWQPPTDEDLTAFLQPEVASQAHPPASMKETPPGQTGRLATQEPGDEAITAVLNESHPAVAVAPQKINPESVQDIRQQAEFFVSLGQTHRAIQILNQHIATSDLPSPLICMDLLGLYQHANQVAEFDQLRDVCHQHFNVQLPDLATFQQEGQGLASYPEVQTTLTRLWPGEQAQAFMDTCIFLKAATQLQTRFDLAAFRDLLTLHAVAEELALPIAPPEAPAAKLATQAIHPLDRPLDALDVFPDLELPDNKPVSHPAESSKTNGLGLDFVLPQDPPPASANENPASRPTPR